MKSLIIGLGNPIMGDDGIGCKCAEVLQAELGPSGLAEVEVEPYYRGGISLMERMIGYDRVLIIDSITGSGKKPGAVSQLNLDEIPSDTMNSPHDGSLKNALEFGMKMGEDLPHHVDILAVEIEPKFEFSEELSTPVEASVMKVLQFALDWIKKEKILQI